MFVEEKLGDNSRPVLDEISLLVKFATFEFATYITSLPIGKVQNLHPWRGKLKRTRNMSKVFIF